jgi:hypothetical protein
MMAAPLAIISVAPKHPTNRRCGRGDRHARTILPRIVPAAAAQEVGVCAPRRRLLQTARKPLSHFRPML